jgi:hypothetical protein
MIRFGPHEVSRAPTIDKALLKAYSRGEITRREIEEQSGQIVSFGALLMLLHEHHLPLPRIPSDPQSPGVQLIKHLAERAARR